MNLSSLDTPNPLAVFHFGQHGAPLQTRASGLIMEVASEAVAYVARSDHQGGSKRGAEKQRPSYRSHVALPFVGTADQLVKITMSLRFHDGDFEVMGASDWPDGHEGLETTARCTCAWLPGGGSDCCRRGEGN
jgi:hypothetical protein